MMSGRDLSRVAQSWFRAVWKGCPAGTETPKNRASVFGSLILFTEHA